MSLSWYVPRNSFLHRASATSKIAFLIFLWIITFIFDSPVWNTLELIFILAVIVATGIPMSSLSSFVKVIVPVMIIFLILFPLVDHGGIVYFRYSIIEFGSVGVSAGIIGATRLGSLFFSTIGVVLATTKERDLIGGMMKGGVPFGASFLLMMSLRFVSLSMNDLTIIREARRARAMPEHENLIQLLKNLISIVIPLFLATIRRIQTSSNALEVKGFGAGAKRSSMQDTKPTGKEIFWIAFFIALTAFFASLRLSFGFFT